MGVDTLSESGVTLQGRVTTQPREQWKVGREYNRRIKNAFDAEGISSPFTSIQLLPPEATGEGDGEGAAGPEARSFQPPESRPPS
jgi:small-conductance mechanosensitive channel